MLKSELAKSISEIEAKLKRRVSAPEMANALCYARWRKQPGHLGSFFDKTFFKSF